jgi:hypothetical protein
MIAKYPQVYPQWSSPARRFADFADQHCGLGDWGFMPLRRRNSNGIETSAKRFLQYCLIRRYSIFFVPAMISGSQ